MKLHFIVDQPNPAANGFFGDVKSWFVIGGNIISLNTPAQQGRCHHCGDQHHKKNDGVQVVFEDANGNTDGSEDKTHFASWNHSDSNDQLVCVGAHRAECGKHFSGNGNRRQNASDNQHVAVKELGDVGVNANLHKEHGDKDASQYCKVACNAIVMFGACQCSASNECTDDWCELRTAGSSRECKGDSRGYNTNCRGRCGSNTHPFQNSRKNNKANSASNNKEANSKANGADQACNVNRSLLNNSRDNGEDDEPQHIVGNGCPKNNSSLGRRQCFEVSKHACCNANACGGKSSTQEQGCVQRLA